MTGGNPTSRWQSHLESLARPLWLPLRNALREDMHAAMHALRITNLGFAQRIESMDKRQISTFANALGPVRILNVHEAGVMRILRSAPQPRAEDIAPGLLQLGSYAVTYLTVAGFALQDRYNLAMEHFGFQQDEFGQLLRDAMVGDLLERKEEFVVDPQFSLLVTVPMEVLADRVLNGACEEELHLCRMGHAASTHTAPTQFGAAA
jgi:hypothetical protein